MISFRWSSPWVLLVAVAVLIAVLDQISKVTATDAIGPDSGRGPVDLIPGLLEFRYVENTGAAFGILQDSTTLLIFVSFGVVILLAWVFWKLIAQSLLLATAFGLQFGGAIGNLVDRIRLGYVVDFIDVPVIPVFNIADAGITVGVTLLVLVLVFKPEWIASDQAGMTGPVETDDPVRVLADSEPASHSRQQTPESAQDSTR